MQEKASKDLRVQKEVRFSIKVITGFERNARFGPRPRPQRRQLYVENACQLVKNGEFHNDSKLAWIKE